MHIRWHAVCFNHSCGLKGTILEVCVSQDGEAVIGGLCVHCGTEFSITVNMANLIARSAVDDYLRNKVEAPEDKLADYIPVGLPN